MPDVTVRGADELVQKLDRVAAKIQRPDSAASQVGNIVRRRIGQRFVNEGEGDWAPLAEATVETKARKNLDPRILRATGALERAVTNGRVSAEGTRIRYSPEAPFYGQVVVARRPILPSGDEQLGRELADALSEQITEAMR